MYLQLNTSPNRSTKPKLGRKLLRPRPRRSLADYLNNDQLLDRANFPLLDCLYYKPIIEAAVERVSQSGQTILGEGVRGFEEDFANWLGAGFSGNHCVGVGNGTDALELALRCAGIAPGDGVIVPSLTAYATVAAILRTGAEPVFADIESEKPVISPAEVERLLTRKSDRPVRAVIAVHLYGEACDLDALQKLCQHHGVALIEDCAQAMGTTYQGSPVGTRGDFAAFSFYPTKNLAALGDGGMLVVGKNASQPALEHARRLRFYGWNEKREAVDFGVNSRLDEIQAWILRGKIQDLKNQINERRNRAAQYSRLLDDWASLTGVSLPEETETWRHSYHLYVIRVHPDHRDHVLASGKVDGVPYSVHYSLACHQHPFMAQRTEVAEQHLPNSERFSASVLTLPLNPYVTPNDVNIVSTHLQYCYRS
ncbi:MAG: DegT/DnrJ/EryC1/StrS family aminotransferase [Cyanobacteriota bacterium]|nr:DegT/DnrJ/EryC1/StrS family aminotransferase [Cyanobacteriota bacterium]